MVNQQLLKLRVVRARCASSTREAAACHAGVSLPLVRPGVRLAHGGLSRRQFGVLQLVSASSRLLVALHTHASKLAQIWTTVAGETLESPYS